MPKVRCRALLLFTQMMYLTLKSVVVAVAVMLRRLVLALVTTCPPFTPPVNNIRLSVPPTPREFARPRLLCPRQIPVLLRPPATPLVQQRWDGWFVQPLNRLPNLPPKLGLLPSWKKVLDSLK